MPNYGYATFPDYTGSWGAPQLGGPETGMSSYGVPHSAVNTGTSWMQSPYTSAAIGAVGEGIGTYFKSQAEADIAKYQAATNLKTPGLIGEQQRQTAEYTAALANYYANKNKYRASQGLSSWKAYAQTLPNDPGNSALNYFASLESPNQIADPGEAPIPPGPPPLPPPGPKKKSALNKIRSKIHKHAKDVADPLKLFH